MFKKSGLMMLALVAAIAFAAPQAQAFKVNDNHQVYGYSTFWGILNEDNFAGKSVTQESSGDKGKDTVMAFKIKQARLGAKGKLADGLLGYNVLFDGAGASSMVAFVEGWVTITPFENFDINLGQFRPYGSYEVDVTSGSKIDNLDTYKAGDSQSKKFLVLSNNTRDRGIEFVVNKLADIATLKVAVTNGLGNTADGGGTISGGTVGGNAAFDAAYTVGLIVTPMEGVRLNAGYGLNKHENAVTSGSDAAVVDVDRTKYSVGGMLNLKDVGVWADAEYAALKSADKDTLLPGYESKGYYVRAGYYLIPKALDIYARYQGWDEISATGAKEKKNTGYDIALRYQVDTFAFTLEYEKQDKDGTSDDPARLAFRTVLIY